MSLCHSMCLRWEFVCRKLWPALWWKGCATGRPPVNARGFALSYCRPRNTHSWDKALHLVNADLGTPTPETKLCTTGIFVCGYSGWMSVCLCMHACVRERECVCVCVCVCVWESVCVWERERVCVRERECVCVRERERECVCVWCIHVCRFTLQIYTPLWLSPTPAAGTPTCVRQCVTTQSCATCWPSAASALSVARPSSTPGWSVSTFLMPRWVEFSLVQFKIWFMLSLCSGKPVCI